MSNPLVAEKQDSTSAISGISILEAGKGLKDGIESGDWAATVMGAVGVGMEALAAVMDPFGAILAAGVGWLIEHVGPLKEALDKLAGDPDQVHAYSETWKNISKEVSSVAQDLAAQVKKDIESWEGGSADAYRKQAEEVAKTLEGAAQACDGAGSGVKTAGDVVGAVRMLVRDIISQVVAHLISWALQVLFTLGIGMAWVVPQVVNLVAKTAKQIAELVKNLTKALKELGKLLTKARGLFDDVAKSMKGIKAGGKDATHTPKEIKAPGGDSTKPSGAKDTPNDKGGGGSEKPPPGKDESTNTSGAHDGPGENKGGGNHEPPPREPAKDETPGNGGAEGGAGKNERGNESGDPAKDKTEASNAKNEGDSDPPCLTDPVVISSGEVLVEDFDLELPELLVRRTHRSSYRSGRWFGSTWASTVDQRLEFGDEYVRYYGPEGVILYYPMPAGDEPVLPIEGARWPLTRHADGSCTIEQVRPDRTMRFSGEGKALPLRSIEDADGSRTELSYADSGAPALLTHSSGLQVGFRTDGHRITELRMIGAGPAPDVVVRGYRYNYQGHLSEVVNSSGTAKRYTYDPDGRVTSWEDRNGVVYRYVYDAEGRCVRTEGAQGIYSSAFEYHPAARITRFTDSLGHVSEYEYNLEGRPVRETDPLGNVTLSEWDRYGNLLRRVDPLGRVTEYTYADDGTPLTIARPDGSLAELEHDGTELVSITVRGNGKAWQRRYDQPGGPEVPGFPAEFEAEASDEELDQFGRPRSAPEIGGGRTQLGWTVDGKPASRVGVRRERAAWRYDREGNEIEHVDELGRVTRREYGPFDVVTAVVDPSGARTSYTYDTELRLTSVTDPLNRTWTYTYDPLGRLVAQTDFDGRTRTYAYDAAGQPIRVTEPDGSVTENEYDLLGNRIEIRGPHRTVRYAYDPVGNVVRVESADSVVEFDRDLYGRIVRESIDGVEVRFSYDEQSQTIRRRTPSGAESVWTFDEQDRPVSLTTAGHTVRYRLDDEGRVLARDTDGISTLQQAFGPRGLVTVQQVSRGTTPVQRRGLEYYADGSLAAVQDSLSGKSVFTRDPAGRVVAVSSPAGTEELRYNPAGELTAWSGSPGLSADYDSLGRRIRHREVRPDGVRVWEYAWTGDLLTGLRTPDGVQWRYRYDPLGRRIAKERLLSDGSVAESTRFVWDGFVLIEQEHTDPAGVRRTTTWERRPGSDEPVTQLERGPGGDRFASVVTDAIGTPTELIDEHGGLAWSARRSLWGRVQPGGIPLQFPGQYADAESGLHYNVFRYYDPAAARYLSQDPLGLEGGPNPVSYVPDPFAAYDPLGLEGCGKGKGKGKDADPPPADSTAKHNSGNGGGSTKSASTGKGGNKRKRDDDGTSASSDNSSKKTKTDDEKEKGPWARPDKFQKRAQDAINAQKKDPKSPFYNTGDKVHARHIISFQTMRDNMKKWVEHQPVKDQAALTKKYTTELRKMNSNPNNLPLGPGKPNTSIGSVVDKFPHVQERIKNGETPVQAFDNSSGYLKDIKSEYADGAIKATDHMKKPEQDAFMDNVKGSSDFDWPGGTKEQFKDWSEMRDRFLDLGKDPGKFTSADVDKLIKDFDNLKPPTIMDDANGNRVMGHPYPSQFDNAPKGDPFSRNEKGEIIPPADPPPAKDKK